MWRLSICSWAIATGPLGLVDNSSDLESEDCGLESRMGVHWRNNAPNLGQGLVSVACRKSFPVLVSLIQLAQVGFSLKTNCIRFETFRVHRVETWPPREPALEIEWRKLQVCCVRLSQLRHER